MFCHGLRFVLILYYPRYIYEKTRNYMITRSQSYHLKSTSAILFRRMAESRGGGGGGTGGGEAEGGGGERGGSFFIG